MCWMVCLFNFLLISGSIKWKRHAYLEERTVLVMTSLTSGSTFGSTAVEATFSGALRENPYSTEATVCSFLKCSFWVGRTGHRPFMRLIKCWVLSGWTLLGSPNVSASSTWIPSLCLPESHPEFSQVSSDISVPDLEVLSANTSPLQRWNFLEHLQMAFVKGRKSWWRWRWWIWQCLQRAAVWTLALWRGVSCFTVQSGE